MPTPPRPAAPAPPPDTVPGHAEALVALLSETTLPGRRVADLFERALAGCGGVPPPRRASAAATAVRKAVAEEERVTRP